MADVKVPPPRLPGNVEETVLSIARLRAEHRQNASPLQTVIDSVTAFLGRPLVIGLLTLIVGAWAGLNFLATALGYRAIDPPPFLGMGSVASLLSLYLVVLILVTQRREYELGVTLEQLTLELAILSEQKLAKVIELLEEARRDNPLVRDRVDKEAEAMAQPADPQSVLEAIKETDVGKKT